MELGKKPVCEQLLPTLHPVQLLCRQLAIWRGALLFTLLRRQFKPRKIRAFYCLLQVIFHTRQRNLVVGRNCPLRIAGLVLFAWLRAGLPACLCFSLGLGLRFGLGLLHFFQFFGCCLGSKLCNPAVNLLRVNLGTALQASPSDDLHCYTVIQFGQTWQRLMGVLALSPFGAPHMRGCIPTDGFACFRVLRGMLNGTRSFSWSQSLSRRVCALSDQGRSTCFLFLQVELRSLARFVSVLVGKV